MSQDLDHELLQYDLYMTRAQRLMEAGCAAEARLFEALAELCYEKARMFEHIEGVREQIERRKRAVIKINRPQDK